MSPSARGKIGWTFAMARRRRKTTNLLMSTVEAQAAMCLTLGVRIPQLLSGTMTGAERHRMVAEKTAAMAESTQAVAQSAGRMMLNPWSTLSPGGLMSSMVTLSSAATKPFYSRVKANARRLTRAQRNGSG